jgi:hypothetical protein
MDQCEWCDAEAVWIVYDDKSPQDILSRIFIGFPGPTAVKRCACNDHKEMLDRERRVPRRWK